MIISPVPISLKGKYLLSLHGRDTAGGMATSTCPSVNGPSWLTLHKMTPIVDDKVHIEVLLQAGPQMLLTISNEVTSALILSSLAQELLLDGHERILGI